jgi:hypothetical protein
MGSLGLHAHPGHGPNALRPVNFIYLRPDSLSGPRGCQDRPFKGSRSDSLLQTKPLDKRWKLDFEPDGLT